MDARFRYRVLLALLAAGCAGPGVRPPSPARDLSIESLLAVSKPEHEHYYILIFGSQLPVQVPRYTHTWATVVKTTELPASPPQVTEVHTISWMPATLDIRPYRCWVEKGTNLDLCTTIKEALRHRERVSLWGPYETWQGLYRRFETQRAFLDAGMIGYQCTDGFGEAARVANGCNCFHALTDMDPEFDRSQYPLLFYGDAAAKNIVRQLFTRPILIHAPQTHDWLIPALGLDCNKIVRRHYDGPAKEFSPEAIQEELANPTPQRKRLLP
jgi:hypothetical protein